jgi:putative membrane protein
VWHAPPLYQATLTREDVHFLQHASFFGTALLFWWVLLHPVRHRRLGHGLGVLFLFTTALYGSALGALLTFASSPWYPAYAERAAPWGLSALEDQQLGGLIMWIPFGLLYTLAALALFGLWFRAMEAGDAGAPRRPVTDAIPLRPGAQGKSIG